MEPQHILMTADTVGGVWTYVLDLAGALSARGVRTTIATMGPRPSGDQRADGLAIRGLQIIESDYKLEWQDDPWTDVDAAGLWLLDLCSSLQPDVVHLNGFAHGALRWPVPAVLIAHSCVFSWWRAIHGTAPPPPWSLYRERVITGLRGASAVAAVSGWMAGELHRHYGFAGAITIPNGRRSEAYRVASKEPFVLTCGRIWDAGKNLALLDQAAAALPWPVYAAGAARSPGGSDTPIRNMRPVGKLSVAELSRWYSRASVYALPALYEPFGLSVLEAALCGCALALADIGSLRENWEGAALFVDPRDAAAWAEALTRLAADESLRTRLAAAALTRARNFALERFGSDYLELYRRASSRGATVQEARQHCAS